MRRPLEALRDSPFYVNLDKRPWLPCASGQPRRAAVSAFGFGGSNFHAVLEEYTNGYLAESTPALRHWPAELLVWRRTPSSLISIFPQKLLVSSGPMM